MTTDRVPVALDAELLTAPDRLAGATSDSLAPFQSTERTRLELRIAAVRHRDQWQPATSETTAFVDGIVSGFKPGGRFGCSDSYRGLLRHQSR